MVLQLTTLSLKEALKNLNPPPSSNSDTLAQSRHLIVRTLRAQPRLVAATLVALATAALLPYEWTALTVTRCLIAWNVGTAVYLGFLAHMCLVSTPTRIRRRALVQAESSGVMLLLVVLAVLACLVAIVVQLALAKSLSGASRNAHIALALVTIISSWAFTHTIFALHYAHDYYAALARKLPPGLSFPDCTDPDYGDFLYCAFVIGTSGQTADVAFSSKPMRRVGLVHCVLAFLFNTTVLAMTINIAASFF